MFSILCSSSGTRVFVDWVVPKLGGGVMGVVKVRKGVMWAGLSQRWSRFSILLVTKD